MFDTENCIGYQIVIQYINFKCIAAYEYVEFMLILKRFIAN